VSDRQADTIISTIIATTTLAAGSTMYAIDGWAGTTSGIAGALAYGLFRYVRTAS
jgi:hypothetical protein